MQHSQTFHALESLATHHTARQSIRALPNAVKQLRRCRKRFRQGAIDSTTYYRLVDKWQAIINRDKALEAF